MKKKESERNEKKKTESGMIFQGTFAQLLFLFKVIFLFIKKSSYFFLSLI